MIIVAKISVWVGLVLLLFGLCSAIGALLVLPFNKLMATNDRQVRPAASARPSTNLNDAGVGISLLAWPIYAVFTSLAFFDESFTLFSNAGFGYVYITLGMPAFLVAWLGLIVYACIRTVPTSWMFGVLGAAAVVALGYGNIN